MLALAFAPQRSPDPGMDTGDLIAIVAGLLVLAVAIYFCWLHIRLVQAFEKIATAQEHRAQLQQAQLQASRPAAPSPTRNVLGCIAVLLGIALGVACDPTKPFCCDINGDGVGDEAAYNCEPPGVITQICS